MRHRIALLGVGVVLLYVVSVPQMWAEPILGVPQLKLSSLTESPYVTMTISSLGATTWSAQADTRYWILNDTGYDWTDLHVSVTGWPDLHDFGCDPHNIFSGCTIAQNGSTSPSWDFYGVGGDYSGVANGMWFDMHFSFGTPGIPGGADVVEWTVTPSTIPEPPTLSLLMTGGAALFARRRGLRRSVWRQSR
jgi:hypothetical protein